VTDAPAASAANAPGTRPTIPPERFAQRLEHAASAATEHGVDALLIGLGSDLRYLTGYDAMPLERLTLLVVGPGERPFIVVPRLEQAAAQAGLRNPVRIVAWGETDDPYALVARELGRDSARDSTVAVSDTLWASHLLGLQRAMGPGTTFEVASTVLRDLRMIKDADEIALLRLAAEAADRVVAHIARGRLVGRTEADVAAEVQSRLVAEGHDHAAFAIVASGPGSASPHHEASDRVIRAGEPIVLDIGGFLGGYASDVTRTLWVTGGDRANGPDEAYRHLFAVLHHAQAAATAAVRPGLACQAIDRAAREVIEAEGYGERFLHRTGHGIGLDVHEDPYLVTGNGLPLREGMAFSVEPGIYLDGQYGARIEDIVVCGADGPLVLNQAPHELLVVDG
jgi:Xaa-Pro aminopeptidase